MNVYSLRAKDRPTVSTPVTWAEVENCLKKKDPNLLVFTSDQVLERVQKQGDLFEPVLKLKQKLPPVAVLEGASAPEASARKTTRSKTRQTASKKSRLEQATKSKKRHPA